jgi:hypothetical protein
MGALSALNPLIRDSSRMLPPLPPPFPSLLQVLLQYHCPYPVSTGLRGEDGPGVASVHCPPTTQALGNRRGATTRPAPTPQPPAVLRPRLLWGHLPAGHRVSSASGACACAWCWYRCGVCSGCGLSRHAVPHVMHGCTRLAVVEAACLACPEIGPVVTRWSQPRSHSDTNHNPLIPLLCYPCPRAARVRPVLRDCGGLQHGGQRRD